MSLPPPATLRLTPLLDQLRLDYRAEVLATGLLADPDLALEHLLFQPLGPTTRPYSKDARPPQEVIMGSGRGYTQLETPREGLYDQLPPLLFHEAEPTLAGPAPAERRRRDREAEQQARRFFLPFDTELYYLRLLRYQRELSPPAAGPLEAAELARAWPIVGQLGPAAGLFMQVLPHIHALRNNRNWLGEFLTLVGGVPAHFEAGPPLVCQAPPQPGQALGECRLGLESVLGQEFADGSRWLHLRLGPVPPARVAEFLPGGPLRALLGQLLDYFLPATTAVEVLVDMAPEPAGTTLADAHLGYAHLAPGQ